MIHEFIDYKKKTKNSGTINGKTLRDSVETCSAEQSGSEWPSPTFVPLWLNNLGLKRRNNQMYGSFTEKPRPDIKNPSQYEQNESEEKKSTVEEDASKKSCYFVSSPKECEEGLIRISESYDKVNSAEKQSQEASNITRIPTFRQIRSELGDAESSSTESTMSPYFKKKKTSKISEAGINEKSQESFRQSRNYQERKKLPKKFNRIKHRNASNHSSFLREEDIDFLLEEKAKKILENYPKKKIQSAASDIKRFEAKLLMLHTKISSGKLTPDDIRFLQEIKIRAGSKENFDKLMRHVREVNLKEIFETQSSFIKSTQAKGDVESTYSQPRKGGKIFLSTDDENDIKRFSEKLKKNLNKEEKRKCLEEVRNYFEKKRRTQLTKCWMLNQENGIEREENLKHDKANMNMKSMFSDRSTTDWKSKFRINDAEVVGKAVDETLQKFAEMYHFHVSPSLMSSMKNNVLKGIQSKTIDGEPPLTWHHDVPCNVEGDKLSKKLNNIVEKDFPEKESLSLDIKSKSSKDKTLSNSQFILKDTLENEQMTRLKSELEYYINSTNVYFTKLKVQSIILEEEKRDSTGENIQFVYSFSKKSMEQKISKSVETLPLINMEVQADENSKRTNAKTQTQNLVTVIEMYVQTEKNPQKSVNTETEGAYAIELRMLKECDVSPRLYRMVRSKQAGRFYLYPENEEHSNCSPEKRKEENKSDVCEGENFKEKKLSEMSEACDPDGKEGKANAPNAHVADVGKLDKEAEASNIREEKQECVWLWDGKKISSGADLKAYVDTLLKEKLKVMSLENSGKEKLNLFLDNFAKEVGTSSQDNLDFTISHPKFGLENQPVGLRTENKIRSFGEGSAETQSSGELHLTSEEKLVKDASTQNSEQAVLSLNVKTWKSPIKSQTSSKTYLRKKRKVKVKKNQQSRKSIAELKKAMHLMRECLSNKRMKFEVETSQKESLCDSGTTLESNLSSNGKNTSDDHLTLIFGMKDGPECRSKRYRRAADEQVQTYSGKTSSVKNFTFGQKMENHLHWDLIERVLHTVNCKKRKGLWNDVRELIKSKLGKDIGSENPKEVCIQIEQDINGALVKARDSVLAKGYYAKNEGDVEVEIDLTLDDLEKIIRRRERSGRRRSLCYKRYSRSLRSSSPRVSRSNFASIQEFRDVLRSVSRARTTEIPQDLRVVRMNKQN